jgi:hypothetical protein
MIGILDINSLAHMAWFNREGVSVHLIRKVHIQLEINTECF